jgi:hypothetical protein
MILKDFAVNLSKMTSKRFIIIFTAVIAISSSFLFSMLSCEKEMVKENQIFSNSNLPIKGSICGAIEQKDILNNNDDNIGTALLFNNKNNFYIELTLPDSLCILNCFVHTSSSLYDFPLDTLNNLNWVNFNHVFRYTSPGTMKRLIIPLTEIPNRSYLAVAIEYGRWENQELIRQIAWIDGIRYGSSIRGRVTAFDKKLCLKQPKEGLNL